jgi:hypothetical protein
MSTEITDTIELPEETADRIVLTLPGGARLRGVATLVLGGIGSRLDLPYEKVDDLQLAVLSVLAASDLGTVTLDVQVEGDRLLVNVGPLPEGISADRGLQRVLERLVDAVERGDGGAGGDWIGLALTRVPSEAGE